VEHSIETRKVVALPEISDWLTDRRRRRFTYSSATCRLRRLFMTSLRLHRVTRAPIAFVIITDEVVYRQYRPSQCRIDIGYSLPAISQSSGRRGRERESTRRGSRVINRCTHGRSSSKRVPMRARRGDGDATSTVSPCRLRSRGWNGSGSDNIGCPL